MRIPAILLLAAVTAVHAQTVELTNAQALSIGKRIWQNECAGTVAGLTSWNSGEAFASLGIGHFIWYPANKPGPFEESFPKMASYLASHSVEIPAWMLGPCPWNTRQEFIGAFYGPRMKELRSLLESTIALQASFAAERLEQALPKMLAAAPASERATIKSNFYRVAAQPLGFYALMDYVNFKGEGTLPTERYDGQGWGLLQVLEAMPPTGPALPEFAHAANAVLTRRVKNSPPARDEAKWLPGWRNRIATYEE